MSYKKRDGWCVVSALVPLSCGSSSKWMLHTGGGWGETPHMIVKSFGCTTIHNKVLYKMHHLYIYIYIYMGLCVCVCCVSESSRCTTYVFELCHCILFRFLPLTKLLYVSQKNKYFYFFNTRVQFKVVLFNFFSSMFLATSFLLSNIFTEYLYLHLSKMFEYFLHLWQ